MSLLKLAKKQTQEDNQKAALIDASRESDAKRLEEEISAAMDSVIIPPVDDFTPPDYVDGNLTFSERPDGSQPVFDRYTPPLEKTQEQQDAEAILKSLPETMRPDNYRKIQVNTKSTVIDQIDALEKIYAVVGEAISKRKLMVK
ncbi:MAG: hypothetical protein GY941_27350, partial [Planctomycetes bacterium]|nr:hypothetical protein [Planctomycetota bacterium]